MQKQNIKVLHIITSLEHGGAQLLATKLILERNKYLEQSVYVLIDKGPYSLMLRSKGIQVISPKRSGFLFIFPSLLAWYLKNRPEIVHSWMYHADFVGLILSLLFKRHKLVWSLHHADPKQNKLRTKVIIMFCKFFSGLVPSQIIACSKLASENHIAHGYSKKYIKVINNGINFNSFVNERKLEDVYKFDRRKIVIGHIARWHHIKGHKYFIQMASKLYKMDNRFSFTLVGTGIDWSNQELVELLKDYDLVDAVKLLGEQDNINQVLNNLDIYVSSSINESFSLTLVEAIAAKVLSISTDTGVAREALSNDLCVVDVANSGQLVDAVLSLTSMKCEKILKILDDSYNIVQSQFDENTMFKNYFRVYQSVIKKKK